MKLRRGGNQDVDVDVEIEALWGQGYGASQIQKELERTGKFAGRTPHVRTIRRHIARFKEDVSGRWLLMEASGEEGALVLRYLAHAAATSEGRITQITKGEARWVVRLRQVFPDMEPGQLWNLVHVYHRHELDEQDTTALDLLVGFAPWQSHERATAFLEVLDRRYPNPGQRERQRALSLADTMGTFSDAQKEESDGTRTHPKAGKQVGVRGARKPRRKRKA